jgi:hypothetical protein
MPTELTHQPPGVACLQALQISADTSKDTSSASTFVSQKNRRVVIQGQRARALITPPPGTTMEVTPSRRLGTRDLSTIRFRNNAPTGKLEMNIQLEPLK